MLIETILICLKLLFTKKNILFGPYHGEFGFEVSMNTSIAHSLKKRFPNKEIIVVSQSGNGSLYKFADKFIEYNYDLKDAGYGYGKITDSIYLKNSFLLNYPEYNDFLWIDLCRIHIFLFKKFVHFEFLNLSNSKYNEKSKIITVHFRSVLKNGNDNRSNFSIDNADLLVKELSSFGYEVHVIGHPIYSYCPPYFCKDCRSEDINNAIGSINISLVTIGQLSGPIHLSHLCARPVITWADKIERFETVKMWNPFDQNCLIVSTESFNPSIKNIIKVFESFINPNQ